MMMAYNSTLYVVATPIGNLEEMTPRAIRILSEVEIIACEDTRETLKLCKHFGISKPLISCHEHNEYYVINKIIEYLQEGKDIAIVSDAGYPGISDPGERVVAKCIEKGFNVVVISGPCAFINALVGSGLDTSHFLFYGFLPSKKGERTKELAKLSKNENTLIFYEAPHRILETLMDMKEELHNRKICVARELTKKFEEYLRGTIEEIIERITTNPIKGEIVIIVEGTKKEDVETLTDLEIIDKVNNLIEKGMTASEAIKHVSLTFKVKKNDVYRLFHQ